MRERARAALTELGGADPDRNVGLTDYLLGQADPIGRADASRHLREDPDDQALVAALSERLRELSPSAELPRLPGEPRRPAPPGRGGQRGRRARLALVLGARRSCWSRRARDHGRVRRREGDDEGAASAGADTGEQRCRCGSSPSGIRRGRRGRVRPRHRR